MTDHDAINELLPLTPLTLHILVALAPAPNHGYGVIKAVREGPTGGMNPGTGTFYSAIRRMEDDGLIEEIDDDADDSRRRVYTVNTLGREVLAAESARLRAVLDAADTVTDAP